MGRKRFLVRGENVLLLGEIDLDKDADAPRAEAAQISTASILKSSSRRGAEFSVTAIFKSCRRRDQASPFKARVTFSA
ncbi:hypothetical protein NHQ30_011311 [Ciborinia camelliae]|nr:hypothetical protein NHQ30_011311 [Ciborinia camelliae]